MSAGTVSSADIQVGGMARDGTAFRTLGLVSGRPFKYDESIAPVVTGMSDEHRFLLDLNGFLLLDGALSPQELHAVQTAVEHHSAAPDNQPKPELWCCNKDMEALVFHRSFWPILMELTNGKPKLKGAQFINDDPITGTGATGGRGGGHLHCARTDFGPESATFYQERGQLRCNDMIVFVYLTEVKRGDGGLAVLPGSHKADFMRPPTMFGEYGLASRTHARELGAEGGKHPHAKQPLPPSYERMGLRHVTMQPGDIMLLPEATSHLVLPWAPTDRPRQVFGLRYQMQHLGAEKHWSLQTLERCSPNTRELLSFGHYTHTKGIALHEFVELDRDVTIGSEVAVALSRDLQAAARSRSQASKL